MGDLDLLYVEVLASLVGLAVESLLDSELADFVSVDDVLLSSLLEELSELPALLSEVSFAPFSDWRLGRP